MPGQSLVLLLGIASITHTIDGTPSINEAIKAAAEKSTDLNRLQDDNTILVELDMRYTQQQWAEIQRLRYGNGGRSKRKGYRSYFMRWRGGQVPYTITGGFSPWGIQQIKSGIDEWHKFSCLNIRPVRPGDKESIRIVPYGGCTSVIGSVKEKQLMTLSPGCLRKGIIAHEFGHALGLFHEQSRPDRDQYVRILTENIDPAELDQFEKYNSRIINTFNVPYDYTSIMHYGEDLFSRNKKITIWTKDRSKQKVIGNRYGLSFYDVKIMNLMYNCNERCEVKQCPGEAFQGKDCQCWCKGPNIRQPVIDCTTGRPIGGGNTIGPKPTSNPIPPAPGDLHPKCAQWANAGECQTNPSYMLVNCKFSCRNKPRGIVTQMACIDTITGCENFKKFNHCRRGMLRTYLPKVCRKTCGFCISAPKPLNRNCADTIVYCSYYNNDLACSNTVIRRKCPKTCKVC